MDCYEEAKPCSTKMFSITAGNIKETVMSKGDDIEYKTVSISSREGPYWFRFKYLKLVIHGLTIKPERGGSYIPTPEKYSNPKCGLINIQNDDNECFKWCMKYHQTKRGKNCDRITVLKKVEDKYDYSGVDFPTSYDDIRAFEENNEVAVFIYYIDSENNIRTDKSGK